MLINELSALEDIEKIEDEYCKKYRIKPTNVSWWNPSSDFKARTSFALNIPFIDNVVDYSFSYTLDCHEQLIDKLGFAQNDKSSLVTPSGSVSLVCALKKIRDEGYKRVLALSPHYFTVPHIAKSLGIEFDRIYVNRTSDGYLFDDFALPCDTVLWITNPIYCSGVYYSTCEIEKFRTLLESGVKIVADECLAESGKELSRHLGRYTNFTGIYCPHKTVCMNGIKFSCIVSNKADQKYYDHWSDAVYGCLSSSNVTALCHYLSDDFEIYDNTFRDNLKKTWNDLTDHFHKIPNIRYDYNSHGYLRMVFVTDKNESILDGEGLKKCIMDSGASFIPGSRNHCSKEWGLGFRINLAADSPQFRGALVRLLKTLALL
ncbi:hypothetical protein [Maridesulfovibrio sp.]|uniref:hypothetical protein n=1 Tax=Maridesulfovibrio sp. TaxID=2795000 RepID=UPI0029CA7268|nr:hypothetical protein [Maridesulfovibrio sp.]